MIVPLTPIRFLYRAAELFGSAVGIISGNRHFTYSEFGERCERLASALRASGIQPGDRVAYLSFNTHQLLEGYYGVPMAGAIMMPLNVRLAPAELTAILNHSGARMLLFENEFLPVVEEIREACPVVEKFITLDDRIPQADQAYEEFLGGASPGRVDFLRVDESSIAELFYTSGSTGTPKGVMLSHRTLYLHALSVAIVFAREERRVDLHTIPLFHANGWGLAHVATLLGGLQVMVRRFEPPAVFGLIQQNRATDMCLVPTMANTLLNAPERAQYDCSSLRRIMLGGAAASPTLIEAMEAAFRCEVVAGYGLTETAPVLTTGCLKPTLEPRDEPERFRRQAMAGWPVVGAQLRVADFHGKDVPRDGQTIGEILARGDQVMEGYYKDPEGTSTAIQDGWFHTGDMAVWDSEGYVHIVDRRKDIIISGGENISSLEVERAIVAHPEVYECAVVSAPDDKWGEVPAAVVHAKPGSTLTEESLMEFLRGRLGRFKLPRRIEFSGEPLPKTGTGKIRKLVIRERFWAGREKRVQG